MSNFPMNVFSIFSDQEDNKVDLVKVERQSDYEDKSSTQFQRSQRNFNKMNCFCKNAEEVSSVVF